MANPALRKIASGPDGPGLAETTARLGMLMFLILALMANCGCRRQPAAPASVDDRAGLLSEAERQSLEQYHRRLLEDLDIHLQVTLLQQSPPDIDLAAVQLFEQHALGATTRGAKGVLFLVDPVGRQVRLEIGYDLEAIFTDLFIGYVEREQMIPFFQAGRVADGVAATAELLVGQALGSPEVAALVAGATRLAHLSGGAGARMPVEIGSGAPGKGPGAQKGRFLPQPTPLATLQVYLEVLREQVKDPDLELYTAESRSFFRQWLVTNAQQDNELRELSQAILQAEEYVQDALAVVRFPLANRRNSPYLLRRFGGGWMLDFAAMARLVGFNHKNQWYFRNVEHPYMFAFADWRFDHNGFPHPSR